jgi:hypothetical protein
MKTSIDGGFKTAIHGADTGGPSTAASPTPPPTLLKSCCKGIAKQPGSAVVREKRRKDMALSENVGFTWIYLK